MKHNSGVQQEAQILLGAEGSWAQWTNSSLPMSIPWNISSASFLSTTSPRVSVACPTSAWSTRCGESSGKNWSWNMQCLFMNLTRWKRTTFSLSVSLVSSSLANSKSVQPEALDVLFSEVNYSLWSSENDILALFSICQNAIHCVLQTVICIWMTKLYFLLLKKGYSYSDLIWYSVVVSLIYANPHHPSLPPPTHQLNGELHSPLD